MLNNEIEKENKPKNYVNPVNFSNSWLRFLD